MKQTAQELLKFTTRP